MYICIRSLCLVPSNLPSHIPISPSCPEHRVPPIITLLRFAPSNRVFKIIVSHLNFATFWLMAAATPKYTSYYFMRLLLVFVMWLSLFSLPGVSYSFSSRSRKIDIISTPLFSHASSGGCLSRFARFLTIFDYRKAGASGKGSVPCFVTVSLYTPYVKTRIYRHFVST